MDDLSGLEWSSSASNNNKNAVKPASSSAFSSAAFSSYPSLRPTPSPHASGRNTPISAQGSGAPASGAQRPQAAAKPGQDSFSGLVNFGSAKNPANLSLRERQELLEAEKRKKEEEKRKQHEANYGSGHFLDALAHGSAGTSRTGSPAISAPTQHQNGKSATDGDKDLFAAFSADTKVDNASHFPPPTSSASGKTSPAKSPPPGLDLSNPNAWNAASGSNNNNNDNDDDDPFGLNEFQQKNPASPPPAPAVAADDDDDLLGALSRPVEEFRRKEEEQKQKEREAQQRRRPRPEPGKPIEDSGSDSEVTSSPEDGAPKTGNEPFDKAVAQLVDYGFTPENARRGLTESGAGLNVQAAVNWLLDDAHRQAKEEARRKQGGGAPAKAFKDGSTSGRARRGGEPAWMRDDGGAPRRGESQSPGASGDDFAKTAAALGSNFLKSANSLWKTGQKQLQKAVQELQQEVDPSQPKWMRSAAQDQPAAAPSHSGESRRRAAAAAAAAASASATDEALMLESGVRPDRKPSRPAPPPAEPRFRQETQNPPRTQSPASGLGSGLSSRNSPVPRWQQNSPDPRARLSKQAVEEESAQVYVSSRRRRPPAPAPASKPAPGPHTDAPPEGDLLSNSTALPKRPAQPKASSAGARPSPRPTPSPKPAARPPRQVPPVNKLTLQSSAKNRAEGAVHFKRGDYAAAHAAYSSSLTGIPASHPLLTVLFCNRALTALKTGEPRQAVSDADAALEIIGPGKGEGESVSLEDGTGETRDLKDLYGKALTRKAEALEQMEKWADAGAVWQQCVEGGIAGPTAIAGRQRCQKALAPKPKPPSASSSASAAASRPRPKPAPARAAAASGGQDSEAVQRLRAANKAAEQEDSEKLALIDKVEARISSWRDGKKDNLRALLGSLDLVLWESSGWKKVGLHELVMANKVKIVYMKAIAKTHPDKLPQDASTEIRMIAGTVFSTLNESWDKFKADNKM